MKKTIINQVAVAAIAAVCMLNAPNKEIKFTCCLVGILIVILLYLFYEDNEE